MPAPRDGFAKIRSNVERSVTLTRVQAGSRADGDKPIPVKARLRRAEITEEYHVKQEIAKNPREEYGGEPTGLIELAVSYDGYEFFPRQAREEIARRLAAPPRPGDKAAIGALVLQDYENISNLAHQRGSIPIEVPLAAPQAADTDNEPDGLGHLSADRWTRVIQHQYTPEEPDVLPVKLVIQLFDPDSLDLPGLDLEAVDLEDKEQRERIHGLTGKITEKIRRQMSFRNPIILHIVACLTIPRRPGRADVTAGPAVTRMSIGWPVITSLRTVSLQVGKRDDNLGADIKYDRKAVRYNPVTRCIEWENVRMVKKRGAHPDVQEYETEPMLLTIQQPGDLYQQGTLEARAEIEIMGHLISGLTARLDNADDLPPDYPQALESSPRLKTRADVIATLQLDDAFTTREFSPYQHLFFDEIIPDEMRITDIRTALRDQGFEEFEPWRVDRGSQSRGSGVSTVNWLLAAYRREGPHRMFLWISVEGRKFDTEREQTALGGGRKHTRTMESGDLSIFIWGTLPGDHAKLNRQMNALQATLRERYERVRQHT
jgi:hypothetical protein